jgi:flagellar assembly factor FliW
MLVQSSRFGSVDVQPDDLLLFREGLIGYNHLHHWVLLADEHHPLVAWLQSVANPQTAMAVVSPRRFLPDYNVRVTRNQLVPLELSPEAPMFVLSILSKNDGQLTLNLRAPLVLNLQRQLGRQVITSDEQPTQHPIAQLPAVQLRKIA